MTIEELGTDNDEDLVLELFPGLFLAMDYLRWDSRFFDRPCYSLNIKNSVFSDDALNTNVSYHEIKNRLPIFSMWAKLPISTSQKFMICLQKLGCYFIETEILLQYDTESVKCLQGRFIEDSLKFSRSIKSTPEELGYLGRHFTETRFHKDPNIGREKGNALWASYMQTYGNVSKRHQYYAFLPDGRAVGAVFISEAVTNRPYNLVDIVVVDPKYQSEKIGTRLMQTALEDFQDNDYPLMVSTQHRNTRAVNFYLKNGFTKFLPSKTILHYWKS